MNPSNEANITILRDLRQRIVDKRDAERRQKLWRLYLTAGAIITAALVAAAAVGPSIDDNADMNATRERAKQIYYAGEGR